MTKIIYTLAAIIVISIPMYTGFLVGGIVEEARYQKIAVADGCGVYDSKTLDFQRMKVMDGSMMEKVLVDGINSTKALKGGKK